MTQSSNVISGAYAFGIAASKTTVPCKFMLNSASTHGQAFEHQSLQTGCRSASDSIWDRFQD